MSNIEDIELTSKDIKILRKYYINNKLNVEVDVMKNDVKNWIKHSKCTKEKAIKGMVVFFD